MAFYRELTKTERVISTASIIANGLLFAAGAVLVLQAEGFIDIGVSIPNRPQTALVGGFFELISAISIFASARRLWRNKTLEFTQDERRGMDKTM